MLVHASWARTRVEVEHVHVEAAAQRRGLRGKSQLMQSVCEAGLVTLHGRQRGAPAQA